MESSEVAKAKIDEAKKALEVLESYDSSKIRGLKKLKRRIESEMKFLYRVLENKSQFKIENVECSNIIQLAAVVDVLKITPEVKSVLEPFQVGDGKKIIVDIVSEDGKKWIKVIMRNPEALHHLFVCGQRGGGKSPHEIAETFLNTAERYQYYFKPPEVHFMFLKGVSEGLADRLNSMGIIVTGKTIPIDLLDPFGSDSEGEEGINGLSESSLIHELHQKYIPESKIVVMQEATNPSKEASDRVNLDVTAMVAYVSSASNGGANYIFKETFLTNQVEWERENPVKKVLDSYFEDNELYACEEAVDHFMKIIQIIGGPGEKIRAKELLYRINVVKNIYTFENILPLEKKIKKVARIVFGTGHALKAPTITANNAFIRSAKNKGMTLSVKLHGPRVLSEMKEKDAIMLTDL